MTDKNWWFPCNTGDWLSLAYRLPADMFRAYFLLFLTCWKEGPLDPDMRELKRLTGVKDWMVQRILQKYFLFGEDGLWHHEWIDQEKKRLESLSETRRKASNQRWNKDEPSKVVSVNSAKGK